MSNSSPETPLDKAIADVLTELDTLSSDSDEFAKATDQLVKLHKLKVEEGKLNLEANLALEKHTLEKRQQAHQEQLDTSPKPVGRDTLVLAGANLLGIVLIVGHERAHIVTSKALGFVKTLR